MNGRTARTESCWPDETPEELFEKLVAEHGQKQAEAIWRIAMSTDPPRKRRVPKKVGVKAKASPGIPTTASHGPSWRDLAEEARSSGEPWAPIVEAQYDERKRLRQLARERHDR